MPITASDFRNGVTFEMDGQVMQVVEFQHVKPGKGAAFVRTKMKNVITGGVTETSFNPTAKFEQAYDDMADRLGSKDREKGTAAHAKEVRKEFDASVDALTEKLRALVETK